MLSWGCSWTCEGSGSSSTKWRRDSTSRLVKVSTGFRSSTTRSNEGREKWRGGFRGPGWLEEEEEKGVGIKLWKTVWFPTALQGTSSLNVSVSPVKAHSKHLRQFTPSDESLLAEELWFQHKADYLSSARSVCWVFTEQPGPGFTPSLITDRCVIKLLAKEIHNILCI